MNWAQRIILFVFRLPSSAMVTFMWNGTYDIVWYEIYHVFLVIRHIFEYCICVYADKMIMDRIPYLILSCFWN